MSAWQIIIVVLSSEALFKFIEWAFDRKDRKEENPILKELAEIDVEEGRKWVLTNVKSIEKKKSTLPPKSFIASWFKDFN